MAERERIEVRSAGQLRQWLVANHYQTESIWVVRYKKHSPFHLSWRDLVREALCFGWIDGQAGRIDADRSQQLLSPRRKGSHWSAINKQHVEELSRDGLILPAGWAAIERAKSDGSWEWLDDIDQLLAPADLLAGLDRLPDGRATWEAYPDSEKKGALHKLKACKRPATRARWLATILDNTSRGQRTFT